MRTRIILALLALALAVPASPALAAPFFNSSEAGCDGSDPSVLFCDDFERNASGGTPGNWYALNCDQANAAGGIASQSKGWCGGIFANSFINQSPLVGAADCTGTQGAAGQCAASSGALVRGGSNGNMADHSFPNNLEHQTVFWRYYRKNSTGFRYSGQKVLTFNRCCAGVGGIFWGGFGFNVGQGSASTGAPFISMVTVQDSRILGQNQGNDIAATSGSWYLYEMEVGLNQPGNSNGRFRLWINNCGATVGGCVGQTPTLRASYTNVNWGKTSSNGGIGSIWLENWANNGDGEGSEGREWYDNVKVATAGPIGPTGSVQTVPGTPILNSVTVSGVMLDEGARAWAALAALILLTALIPLRGRS